MRLVQSFKALKGGGVYNDKPTTLERLKQAITGLPLNVRQRLVLENDEVSGIIVCCLYSNPFQMCYNAEDILPVCEELDVPFVFGEGT